MHNTIKYITPLGNYDIPNGWPMKPYKRPYGGTPGPPVMYEKPSNPEDESAGYGYSNGMSQQERDVFFYHSDHLGSTSYITDLQGNATQFVSYKPYGEALVDEHATSYEMPWKFNGKELDSETGLYYYGARYYEPVLALWYGVDALAEDNNAVSGYHFCHANPILRVDNDGNSDYFDFEGNYIGSDNIDNDYIRIISRDLWESVQIINEDGSVSIDSDLAMSLSSAFSKADNMDIQATLRVYNHYNPTTLELKEYSGLSNNGGMQFNGSSKGCSISVKIAANKEMIGKENPICDHYNEITNSFIHEKKHYDDYTNDPKGYLSSPKDVREIRAILAQMNDHSWKMTRKIYKKKVYRYGKSLEMFKFLFEW